MKHLRQYIRQILLTEVAKQPEDLPDGWFIQIKTLASDFFIVSIEDKIGGGMIPRRVGFVSFGPDPKRNGPCSGAWEVNRAKVVEDGWGPLLYDIAMELAGSNGLMADRRSVSGSAFKVWEYYLNSRSDVTPKQLDIYRPERFKGTITPEDESDDCVQDKYLNWYYTQQPDPPVRGTELKIDKEDYLASHLTKAFVKNNTATIDKLKNMGLLVEQ